MNFNENFNVNSDKVNIFKGIQFCATAVEATYGPNGGNVLVDVLLDHSIKTSRYTKDGYTVANNVKVDKKIYQAGIDLTKEVATKVNMLCGDSTSTAVILFYNLCWNIINAERTGGKPIQVVDALKKDYQVLKEEVNKIIPFKDDDKILNATRIAAKDEALGTMIYNMIKEAGPSVSVNIAYGNKNDYKVEKGCKISINRSGEDITFENPTLSIKEEGFQIVINNGEQILSLQNLGSLVAKEILKNIPEILNEEGKVAHIKLTENSIIITPYETETEKINSLYETYLNMIPKQDEEHIIKVMLDFLTLSHATFYITGETETSWLEIKDRVEDGINTCKSSFLFGVTNGAGFTYKLLAQKKSIHPLSAYSLIAIANKFNNYKKAEVYDPIRSIEVCLNVAYSQAIVFADLREVRLSEGTE